MTGYEKLLASGLPVSWNVMQTGSREGLVSHEDLRAYACDQLGRQDGDTGYLVFLLFDSDPTNYAEILSLLERLAAGECAGDDKDGLALRNLAERTWNVVVMRDWVGSWKRNNATYLSDEYDYWNTDPKSYLPFPDIYAFESSSYFSDSAEFDVALESFTKWADAEDAILRRASGIL